MDAWVITLKDNPASIRMAMRCMRSANIKIEPFTAINRQSAGAMFNSLGLRWTWGEGFKTSSLTMKHKAYGGDHMARVGCFLSHFTLWHKCVDADRPFLILEHDAVFVRPFEPFEFNSICMINDPLAATPRGDWWHEQMVRRGPGIWPKTRVFDDSRPDGLAGNSAYVIQPKAAKRLIDLVHDVGAWPNDAIMCRQFIPDLQEIFPFITQVESLGSTIQT